MSLFAVVIISREAIAFDKSVVTKEGSKFIVTKDYEGWVEAGSNHFHGIVPLDAKIFTSVYDAEKFAKRWKGHPWWCIPSGEYEILEIQPTYRQVIDGYNIIVDKTVKTIGGG